MKLFFAYLRQRWKVLLGAVLFYALFAVSFALYGLPLAAVWYPASTESALRSARTSSALPLRRTSISCAPSRPHSTRSTF